MTYLFHTDEYGKIEVTERSEKHPNGDIYFFRDDYGTTFEGGGYGFKDMYGREYYAYLPSPHSNHKDASLVIWQPKTIGHIPG